MDRQIIDALLLDRSIIDMPIGVIAEPFGLVDRLAGREIELLLIEHCAVDKIHLPILAYAAERATIGIQI